MQDVVGVRFQEAAKVYYFSPAGFEDLVAGEYVVVETSRGLEVARVVIAPQQVVNAEITEPLKPITRAAYDEDLERAEMLKARAREDVEYVRRTVRARDLPMKVVNASYNLDGSRLTIFFMSEGRVDFRDLLRELSQQFGVQVQLRQVGPRDQAKAVDGYGICGRRLCCSSWLTSFPAISIKMAKEQNKPLSPSKISGQCGRLLCCLSYENDMYKQLKAQLPRPGTVVSTPSGEARVIAANALRQMVMLQMETLEVIEMPASALALDRGVVRIIEMPREQAEPDEPESEPGAPAQSPTPQPQARRGPPAPPRREPGPAQPPAEQRDRGQRPRRPQPTQRPAMPGAPIAAVAATEPPAPIAPPAVAPPPVKPPADSTAARQDGGQSKKRRHRRGAGRRRGKGGGKEG